MDETREQLADSTEEFPVLAKQPKRVTAGEARYQRNFPTVQESLTDATKPRQQTRSNEIAIGRAETSNSREREQPGSQLTAAR